MSKHLESRFEAYTESLIATLNHADRAQPARWYMKGLMLPGSRKSVEPMAARVHPQNVRSAHQSMHHLVAQANWSDAALLAAVAESVLPKLVAAQEPVYWIIDDTGFPKKGKHSVGVAHQYCGQSGKSENCRVAVSLSIATARGSLPVGYRLYLPHEWTDDPARCEKTGVPDEVTFATKPTLAMGQIDAALAAGHPVGTVLADAAYGGETQWRNRLVEKGLQYAVGGRRRHRVQRDKDHPPISVGDVARELPGQAWRTLTWREGTSGPFSSRFARIRVRAAHRDRASAEEWLIIEWPAGADEPNHYWFSNLPPSTPWQSMIDTVMSRWRIERDYQELKQELGLGHYEGRNWRGFHHHASLCIAAYGFLTLERLSGSKKNRVRFKTAPLPKGFHPRGAGTHAAS